MHSILYVYQNSSPCHFKTNTTEYIVMNHALRDEISVAQSKWVQLYCKYGKFLRYNYLNAFLNLNNKPQNKNDQM